jgi:hypothetical protein
MGKKKKKKKEKKRKKKEKRILRGVTGAILGRSFRWWMTQFNGP